jgi:hypothetical protein
MKTYDVYITLHDRFLADDEDDAFDTALGLLEERQGMEIMKHEIIEVELWEDL